MSERYIRQGPYVDDNGIYVPVQEYVQDGCVSFYKCIMTREMFVEAYNKWINNAIDNSFVGQDDADDWCE